ncbi:MAG: hypothetical protein FJY85_02215 [Deltaproteobacteria bacterium]|nr:hypothetical protein [Deltaproteobacteria bacterium]
MGIAIKEMRDNLIAAIKEIRDNKSMSAMDEASIISVVVERLLSVLGWNMWGKGTPVNNSIAIKEIAR